MRLNSQIHHHRTYYSLLLKNGLWLFIAVLAFTAITFQLNSYSLNGKSLSSAGARTSKDFNFSTRNILSEAKDNDEKATAKFTYPYPSSLFEFHFKPRITDWDARRAAFLSANPGVNLTAEGRPTVLMVTSTDPTVCAAEGGDFLLMKLMKNKQDYARIHSIPFYHSMTRLEPEFISFWCKAPLLRAALLSHPEVEWVWWTDADAVITDMVFEVPWQKYEDYFLVVAGNEESIYLNKSWVGLNTGNFFLRNCQETLDFLDMLASTGQTKETRMKWGEIVTKDLTGRPAFDVDDQSALIWIITRDEQFWKKRIFLEDEYKLHGYWLNNVNRFEEIAANNQDSMVKGDWNWPFVTHFVGCKICSREYADYNATECDVGMKRALLFADNQVLQKYGYVHPSFNSEDVARLPS